MVVNRSPVRIEDDHEVLDNTGHVVQNVEEEEPDAHKLDSRLRSANVVRVLVAWILITRQRRSLLTPAVLALIRTTPGGVGPVHHGAGPIVVVGLRPKPNQPGT